MSNLVKRMDLRGAKATLAALPWMPRAIQRPTLSDGQFHRRVPPPHCCAPAGEPGFALLALVLAARFS